MAILLALGTFAFAVPQPTQGTWDYPRLDEMWMVMRFPRSVSLEAAQAGEIDVFVGLIEPGDADVLTNEPYNWHFSPTQLGGFHMCYHGFNCRETPPDTAGAYTNVFNRTTDFDLTPVNNPGFRLATQHMIGFTTKTAWMEDIYQYINLPQMFYIPFANSYYVNPYLVPYELDWDKAREILLDNGFTVDPGTDGVLNSFDVPSTDDIWYYTNMDGATVKLIGGPDSTSPGSDRYAGLTAGGDPFYGILVASPGDGLAPPSHENSRRHLRQWNRFFMGVESDGIIGAENTALFIDLPDDVYDYIYFSSFYNRDHDIFMLCWGLSNRPDYLYDLFHPDIDEAGVGNSPGLVHFELDALIETIKFWSQVDYEVLVFNLGATPVVNVAAGSEYELPPPVGTVTGVGVVRVDETGVYTELLGPTDYEVAELPGVQLLTILTAQTLGEGESIWVYYEEGTHSRLLTTLEEMRDLVWLVQWYFYYLNPYNPIYSRNYINLFAPDFTNWTPSEGFGSAEYRAVTGWSFNTIHHIGQPTGGSINWHISGLLESINPILMAWVYEVTIVNRMYDQAFIRNPNTHAVMPYVATNFGFDPWSSEADNVADGMVIKIWLRDDVYWQDGIQVTANDIKWNFDFMASIMAPEFAGLNPPMYVRSEVVRDDMVKVYVNGTGAWKMLDFLAACLQFPQQIWEPFWGDYEAAIAFEPYAISYEDHVGSPPASGLDLTAFVGTGPWYMDFFELETGIAHMLKNPNHWIRSAGMDTNGVVASVFVDGEWGKDGMPRATRAGDIIVTLQNYDTVGKTGVDYELSINQGGVIASGTVDLADWETVQITATLPTDTEPCEHTITLTVEGQVVAERTIAVTIGDVNGNGEVNILDVAAAALCFGASEGDARWVTNVCATADVNNDGTINIVDIALIALHFGDTCQ
jgi:ABC-type transport system substrate-binding protein